MFSPVHSSFYDRSTRRDQTIHMTSRIIQEDVSSWWQHNRELKALQVIGSDKLHSFKIQIEVVFHNLFCLLSSQSQRIRTWQRPPWNLLRYSVSILYHLLNQFTSQSMFSIASELPEDLCAPWFFFHLSSHFSTTFWFLVFRYDNQDSTCLRSTEAVKPAAMTVQKITGKQQEQAYLTKPVPLSEARLSMIRCVTVFLITVAICTLKSNCYTLASVANLDVFLPGKSSYVCSVEFSVLEILTNRKTISGKTCHL